MGFGMFFSLDQSFLNTTSTDFANSCFLFFSLLSLFALPPPLRVLPTVTATQSTVAPPQASITERFRLQRLPPRLFRCNPSLGVGTLLPSRQMQQQQHHAEPQWYDVYAPRRTMFGRVQWCPLSGLCHQLRETRHHVHRMFRWGKLPQCLSVNDVLCRGDFSLASCCLSSGTESQKRGYRKWDLWPNQNHLGLHANFSGDARCV